MINTIESLWRALDCAARRELGLLRLAGAVSMACSQLACGSPHGIEQMAEEAASSAGASALESASWCEVQAVLQSKCQRCHGEAPSHGAPFSLVTFEDTQRLDSKGTARYERIASALEAEYMPPNFIVLEPPVEPLASDERNLVLAWIRGGARETRTASCPGP